MAGTLPGFNPAEFRDAIHFVQEMAAPTAVADRATFHFAPVYDRGTLADEENVPFDPLVRLEPTSQRAPVQVPVGIKTIDKDGELTNLGQMALATLVLSLLDVDYEQVRGFVSVTVGGDRYLYRSTRPPVGLGEVVIWQVLVVAEDES